MEKKKPTAAGVYARAIRMYKAGKSVSQSADALGVTRLQVMRYRKSYYRKAEQRNGGNDANF